MGTVFSNSESSSVKSWKEEVRAGRDALLERKLRDDARVRLAASLAKEDARKELKRQEELQVQREKEAELQRERQREHQRLFESLRAKEQERQCLRKGKQRQREAMRHEREEQERRQLRMAQKAARWRNQQEREALQKERQRIEQAEEARVRQREHHQRQFESMRAKEQEHQCQQEAKLREAVQRVREEQKHQQLHLAQTAAQWWDQQRRNALQWECQRMAQAEEARFRQVEEARVRQIEEARVRQAEEARVRQAEEARVRQAEEARFQQAEEARVRQIEEARVRQIEEARVRQIEEARVRQAEEARVRQVEEDRVGQAEEARVRQAEEARVRQAEHAQASARATSSVCPAQHPASEYEEETADGEEEEDEEGDEPRSVAEVLLEFGDEIQNYIRYDKMFDSTYPLQYKHSLAALNTTHLCDTLDDLLNEFPGELPDTVSGCVELLATQGVAFIVHRGKSVSMKDLTPYQHDDSRVYGEFSCNCGHEWYSDDSYKDKYQKCPDCSEITYPYMQDELTLSECDEERAEEEARVRQEATWAEEHRRQDQRRQRAEAEERQRRESEHFQTPAQAKKAAQREKQRREEQERQDVYVLVSDIQVLLRTMKAFDCAKPLNYKHALNTLNSRDLNTALTVLRAKYPHKYPDTVVECVIKWAAEGVYFVTHNNCRSVSVRDLTPYQADERRVFGEYLCKCGRAWSSAGSWRDKYQQCKACECKVYPYRQSRLQQSDPSGEEGERRPHDCSRCQKCCELGELCLPLDYYAV